MNSSEREFFELQAALSGRFSIEHELGRGGMGIVYLARDVQLERPVAIKLLAPALAASGDMRRRFLREARLAAQCFHPHIVPIHHVEESGALAWFVMAYVRGESLAERVRRAGPLSPDDVRRLAQDIGWALSYAHQCGVVHRDVKPENILIDATSERFLIADFGIARGHDDGAEQHSGSGAGTPRYMAPEQALGDAVDGRADLYALGASLFFAATGRPPFEASSAVALIMQHASAPAPSVRGFAPRLPLQLADAIDRCLGKLPEHRFPTAEAFVEAITPPAAQDVLPVSLRPTRASADSTRTLLGLATAFGIATLSLALGEAPHSFGRDLIAGLGSSLSAFFASIAAFRAGETLLSARRALRAGTGGDDVVRALTADVATSPHEAQQASHNPFALHSHFRNPLLIAMGVALGLAQGAIGDLHHLPDAILGLLQVTSLFGPGYLIARGILSPTSGSPLRRWLHRRIEQPLARRATQLAGSFLRLPAARTAMPYSDAPTELRLGRAVHEVLARLPLEQQQLMKDAASAADGLARDAEQLRREDLVLAEGERLARQALTDEARIQRLEQLQQERTVVQARLATTVAALETLRLELLRLDGNDLSASGLTSHLEAVRHLARRVDAEAELRAYLAHSDPTPA